MIRQEERRFWQTMALSGLARLAGERTPQSFFHVLRGRIASQTHQDVHIFGLHPYYRLFPRLSKERWQEIVNGLAAEGLIAYRPLPRQPDKQTVELTDAGRAFLGAGRAHFHLDEWLQPLDGLALSRRLERFWLRLHLLVQTVSHLLHGQRRFSPIVQDRSTQSWVRQLLSDERRRARWLAGLRAELARLLEPLPMPVQRLLVEQLSGAAQAGQTCEQIACRTGEAPSLLRLQTTWCLTVIVRRLTAEPSRFPLLASLAEEEEGSRLSLSQSARLTARLLERGMSVREIAARRNLKESTVEDHLVEIALRCPHWDWSAYVPPEKRLAVVEAARRLGTRRLRVIKDHLGEGYSYLEIRLALASEGGKA